MTWFWQRWGRPAARLRPSRLRLDQLSAHLRRDLNVTDSAAIFSPESIRVRNFLVCPSF
jgi:hypothetical protein